MDIIVCIKQVPDISEIAKVKTDPKTGTIIREGVPSVVNPFDEFAVEEAVRVKERSEGEVNVTVITMGPPQAEEALRKCLSMGADNAILLSDRAFAGGDTLATGYVLAMAIKKIGAYDMIFCGQQATDGDTAQVGPSIAENIHIPQITYINKLEVQKKKIVAHREIEGGVEVIECRMPVLMTAVKGLNEPRIPKYKAITKALSKEIVVWGAADLDLDMDRVGLSGSPTNVVKVFSPEARQGGQKIQGLTYDEAALKILEILKEEKAL
ncbi:Electron transfer flavoprotein subunit beta [uncultured Desulfobacterium sp.]|uniref:Protein FixA n=1 Tax=uncultured Desulfobacterium sp. TaxID=201089 RepID=A0A445N082_9BACT|nr:Electron transfer flavoprotein subunit beta [uncultured Desulfobacterium sp.]